MPMLTVREFFFFSRRKTAYEIYQCDWSSDVCSSDLVTLLADGGCRVVDNGRGIPVDNHPEYRGKSAAEGGMRVLPPGGKVGGDGYKISGGLHGVGVSVVNALSVRLDLEIHRDGGKWTQSYAKGG